MGDTVLRRGVSFDYFRLLPTELRLEIWRHCLPSRIAEIHVVCYGPSLNVEILDTYLKTSPPFRLSVPTKPPLISRVCQESRSVALNHGGLKPLGPSNVHMWFDKRTDSLSFDPTHLLMFLMRGKDDARNIYVPSTLQTLLSDKATPLCIGSRLIECTVERDFYPSALPNGQKSKQKGVAGWAVEHMSQRTECTVIFEKVALHLNHQDACECGLFGPFAESTPAHVDVQDVSMECFLLV